MKPSAQKFAVLAAVSAMALGTAGAAQARHGAGDPAPRGRRERMGGTAVPISKQLAAGFALVAALAWPSSAMARHGADDPPAADDNGQATQAPGADDQQHTEPGDAQDDRGGSGGS